MRLYLSTAFALIVMGGLTPRLVVQRAHGMVPVRRLPGDESPAPLRAPGLVIKLAHIKAGTFMMGNRQQWPPEWNVVHEVQITRPFYLGIHEVTRGQFRAFVQATGYVTECEANGVGGNGFDPINRQAASSHPMFSWRYTAYEQTDAHPVVNVTYADAMAFCQWLGRRTRRTVDLPTEAEWEYACRAGTKTLYFTGDNAGSLKGYANVYDVTSARFFGHAEAGLEIDDGHVFTTPVGQFKANPWGLFDMQGNVWEMCKDWYGPYEGKRAVDPQGPVTGETRVDRGGSWGDSASFAQSGCRSHFTPSVSNQARGFRVVVR